MLEMFYFLMKIQIYLISNWYFYTETYQLIMQNFWVVTRFLEIRQKL